jgi:hypothetical protein
VSSCLLVDPGQTERPVLGIEVDTAVAGLGVRLTDPRIREGDRHAVVVDEDVADRRASSLSMRLGSERRDTAAPPSRLPGMRVYAAKSRPA